jgi:hypothetical protein
MRFFTVLTLAATATAAAVGSTTIKRNGLDVRVATEPKKCLCKSDVDELVAAYVQALTLWDDSLIKYIADDFYDFSESINSLIPPAGLPMGFPIFNKTTFIQHQHEQPDNLPVIVERLGPWNCDGISLIWHATFTKNPTVPEQKVRGVTIISAAHNDGQWQIKGLDVEFNSIQFLLATGGTITRASPPPS